MKTTNVVMLDKDWWKTERVPSKELVLKKPAKLSERYFSIKEVMRRFSVGYDLIYKAIVKGDLYAEAVGRSYRISEQAIQDWLELCRRKKRLA